MERYLRLYWRPAVWILGSFSMPIAIAGLLSMAIRAYRNVAAAPKSSDEVLACQTIIADPNPPLNVRASPVVAPDNRIGYLPNGTPLSVVDESEGWLKIDSPLQGWVYKELTVTTCTSMAQASALVVPISTQPNGQNNASQAEAGEQGVRLLAIAMEQYQAGNLNGAIALAKTVPAESSAYQPAQAAIVRWPQDWEVAESRYYTAQKALRDGRWKDAIQQVNTYPNIRFWKEKLAPVVQRAIERSQ